MTVFAENKGPEPTRFLNIGHRGACAYAPENSANSIEEAISRNVDMVEFDLRQTADGSIVLFHDSTAVTRSGKRVPVSRISFSELYDVAAAAGFRLSTFEEILQEFGSRIPLDIEIKVRGFEEKVIQLLEKYPPAFEPVISSFIAGVIGCIRKLDPSIKTALVLGYSKIPFMNIIMRPIIGRLISKTGVDSVHLHRNLVSRRILRKLFAAGVKVYVWTVNKPDEMTRLLKAGVDGIITDTPDVLYDICRKMAESQEPVLSKSEISQNRFFYAAQLSRSR